MTSNDSAVTVIIFFWNAVNSSINLPAFRVQTFADFKNLVTYMVFNLIYDYPPSVAVNTKWYRWSFLTGRVFASWTYHQEYSLVVKESAPNINGKYERLKQLWVYTILSSTLKNYNILHSSQYLHTHYALVFFKSRNLFLF